MYWGCYFILGLNSSLGKSLLAAPVIPAGRSVLMGDMFQTDVTYDNLQWLLLFIDLSAPKLNPRYTSSLWILFPPYQISLKVIK
jgi:hypothetical protein